MANQICFKLDFIFIFFLLKFDNLLDTAFDNLFPIRLNFLANLLKQIKIMTGLLNKHVQKSFRLKLLF